MTDANLAAILDAAVAAHQRGNPGEALEGYKKALALAPNDAEANSLYGLARTHLRQFSDAETHLIKAVELEPQETGFRLNLIEYLEQAGEIDRALKEVDGVLRIDENNSRAFEKLGDLSIRAGKPGAATDAYQKAVELEPGFYPLIMKLARAHAGFRNFKAARGILEQAVQFGPRDENYLELYSFVLAAVGDITALSALTREWVQKAPESAPAWRAFSHASYEAGKYREAIDAFRKVLDLGVRDADTLAAYGRVCLDGQEFEEAHAVINEAETLDANHPETLAAKAQLLTYEGKFEDAETYCRRCLAVNPNFAGVYSLLSRLKGGKLADEDQKALADLAWNKELHPSDRKAAAFALGRALDTDKKPQEAFKVFQHANDIAIEDTTRAEAAYLPEAAQAHTDQLIKAFPQRLEVEQTVARTPRPIFIIGMPRSGTTLIESLLSAHPEVFGAGERPDAQHLLNGYLRTAEEGAAPAGPVNTDWIDSYYQELPDTGDAKWLTDKNPLNFEAVGLIDRLFPDAPIIHIRRDPVETGLSIFAHEFSRFWSFANRLEDIGHYYGQYARLMAHWDKAFPGRVITLQYEDFAGDFDTAAPTLTETIGLNWTPEMAAFQKADRPISTFSAVQAREPVSVRRGKADAYGALLEPLRDALNAAGVDLKTGALKI